MEQRISRTNLYDSLNRIKQVTTKAGDIQKNHYEYDVFGNATVAEKSVSNRFGFCGEIRDAVTGQYYLRARFYNPVVARFMSEDTYYGDGLNLYAYYHNNPVGWIDPSGHEGICAKKYGELSEKYKNDPKSLTQNEIQQMRDYEATNGKTSYGKSSHNLEKTKGWKVGDPIDNLTKAGNEPSWNTVKKRYWKNEAYYNGELYSERNLEFMKKGNAPHYSEAIDVPMELHHIEGRKIPNPHNESNLLAVWPWEHDAIDPYRFYTGPRP